jgi:hypothetical protein
MVEGHNISAEIVPKYMGCSNKTHACLYTADMSTPFYDSNRATFLSFVRQFVNFLDLRSK